MRNMQEHAACQGGRYAGDGTHVNYEAIPYIAQHVRNIVAMLGADLVITDSTHCAGVSYWNRDEKE